MSSEDLDRGFEKEEDRFQAEVAQSRFVKREEKKKEQEFLEKQKTYQTAAYLAKRTNFEPEQIKTLLEIHKLLVNKSKMDRLKFREIFSMTFGITDDIMLDRLYCYFDGDNEGDVSESEFVMGLAIMLRGSLDDQIKLCYEVYDINGDGSIGRDELQTCLKNCLHPIPQLSKDENDDLEVEGHRDIVEIAIKHLDTDKDGFIREKDFSEAVHKDPLLLQAVGPCLPPSQYLMTFTQFLTNDIHSYSEWLSKPKERCSSRDSKLRHSMQTSKLLFKPKELDSKRSSRKSSVHGKALGKH